MKIKLLLALLAGILLVGVSKVNAGKTTFSSGNKMIFIGTVDSSDEDMEDMSDEEFSLEDEFEDESETDFIDYLIEKFPTPFTQVIEED